MRSKSGPQSSAEAHVREIRRVTRKKHSAEERIRIVLEGLRVSWDRNGRKISRRPQKPLSVIERTI